VVLRANKRLAGGLLAAQGDNKVAQWAGRPAGMEPHAVFGTKYAV